MKELEREILLAFWKVHIRVALLRSQPAVQPQGASASKPTTPTNEIAALRAEIEVLKGKPTDQAHVMTSVAYHYANLWFAGQKENWPLAEFYWTEVRSHMSWAVRVIPVRKDPQGNDVRLPEILDPIEKSAFEDLHKTISDKNVETFRDSYKQMLDSCYACHLASGKPFLRLQIPERPPEPLIRFEPPTLSTKEQSC
ncbi:MAG: hypothetical protein L0Z50_06110 [Verrucomicrobiales bacterium]|nr:hypothetical protein [Verrucomicrobiales bacterium]